MKQINDYNSLLIVINKNGRIDGQGADVANVFQTVSILKLWFPVSGFKDQVRQFESTFTT